MDLGNVLHGLWFQYRDSGDSQRRLRYAQCDILVEPASDDAGPLILLEAKLTLRYVEAYTQLRNLYIPLVEMVYARKVIPVIVCQNLAPTTSPIKTDLLQATLHYQENHPDVIPIWYYNSNMEQE